MDANWFLSACAQTSGAIVAVIGGFLVSRLVSLSAERNGQGNRLQEVTRSFMAIKLDEIKARSELDSFLKGSFRKVVLEECIAAWERTPSFEAIYAKYEDVCADLPVDEHREVFQQAQSDVGAAFRFLDERVPDGCTMSLEELIDEEVLDRSGISIDALEEVFFHLVAERLHRPFYGNVIEDTARKQIRLQQRLAFEERWRQLAREVKQLQGVEQEIKNQLTRLGQPGGFGMLFFSLCYLAFFGILAPLVLLLIDGGHHNTCIVVTVLSLFAAGVALVLASLVREHRGLATADFLKEHHENMET